MAGAIGISRQLAIHHLRDLRRKGFVRIERKAFRIVAFAEELKTPPPGTPQAAATPLHRANTRA